MNQTKKITFLIGVSASGKSTWANQYVRNNPKTVIISRDCIRRALFGSDSTPTVNVEDRSKEDLVSRMQISMIKTALEGGYDVIIDNTNLKQRYIMDIRNKFPQYDHRYKIMDISLDIALSRNKLKVTNPPEGTGPSIQIVTDDQIRMQYENFIKIKDWLGYLPDQSETNQFPQQNDGLGPIVNDPRLPPAVIFDLDGTLAHHRDRSVFDYMKAGDDDIDPVIADIYKMYFSNGIPIILCTGRGKEGEKVTKDWLKKHDLEYVELHMRQFKDNRKDYVVKEEYWRSISTRYNIICMFDDRDQVVNHARKHGFKVLQVANGDF